MRIVHEVGAYVAVLDDEGVERLRYDYGSAPKPFLHPIRLPDGTVVTDYEPQENPWHRGLWFAWKFVNGKNYWEEDEESGRQVAMSPPLVAAPRPNQVRVVGYLEWRDLDEDGDERTRLVECREMVIRFDPEGALVIDWISAQTPTEDIVLDRTPYTTWGGYGGLVARLNSELHSHRFLFDNDDITQRPTGEPHAWGAAEGKVGTSDLSVVFLPHPGNRRFPEPFYGHAREGSTFFGPAPLFHEPLLLQKGETLRHQVRVLVLPRQVHSTEIAGYYEEWSQT